MIRILSVSVCLTLCSCFNVKGTGWSITALGTDIDGIDLSAASLRADKINNSRSLKHVKDGTVEAVKIIGTNKLIGAGIDGVKSIGNNTIEAISDSQ